MANFRSDFRNAAEVYRKDVFEEYVDRLGSAKLLTVLEEEFPLCHSEAHDLGRVIFSRTKDFADSIQECRDQCTGGCFHGVLMEAFGEHKEEGAADKHVWEDEIAEKMNDICSDASILALHRKGKCVHGIGHALTFLMNYDIQKSLDLCARFDSTPLEFYCAGGAFMEYSIAGPRESDQKLRYPCDRFTKFPAACYPFVMEKMLNSLGSKEAVEKECLALSGLERIGCFRGFGILYAQGIARDPRSITGACLHGNLSDQRACLEGAIIKLTEVDEEKASSACTYLEGERKSHCEETVRLGAYSLERSFELYFK